MGAAKVGERADHFPDVGVLHDVFGNDVEVALSLGRQGFGLGLVMEGFDLGDGGAEEVNADEFGAWSFAFVLQVGAEQLGMHPGNGSVWEVGGQAGGEFDGGFAAHPNLESVNDPANLSFVDAAGAGEFGGGFFGVAEEGVEGVGDIAHIFETMPLSIFFCKFLLT